MRGRLLFPVLALLLLAGCGGPYASDVQTPSGREGEVIGSPPAESGPATVSATMRVTSLPADQVGTATGEPVNCLYIGPDDSDNLDGPPQVDAVDVEVSWADEVPGTSSTMVVSVYNHPDYATTMGGPSPVTVHAVPGAVPLFLPLAIRVSNNGPLPVAVAQQVEVHVEVTGFTGTLIVWPIACQD